MSLDDIIEQAKVLMRAGDYPRADALLRSVLEQDPSKAHAVFERATIALINGRIADAERGYRKVVELDGAFNAAHLELARIYYRQRKLNLALEQYRALTLGPGADRHVYREMGRLCEEMGSPEGAVQNLRRGAAACPEDLEIRFELARLLRESGNEKEAAGEFGKVLALPEVRNDRFLHNKVLNELEITERREVLESKPRAMIAMIIDRCNIHCRICGIWKGKWQVRDSVMKEIVDLFPVMEDICWEGGEVFLMKGFDDILAEGAKHPHLKQVIFTNGLLITEKILEKISTGRADIVFSIDAVNKETYEYIRDGATYEKLIASLELVREFRKSRGANISIYLNPVIMRANHLQLDEIVEFGKRYDFNAITFTPIRGMFGDENIFELKDGKALDALARTLPGVIRKAEEYGVRLNNWLPVDLRTSGDSAQGQATQSSCAPAEERPRKVEPPRMICYAPWQRLTIDSGGPARPFAFCLNRYVGDTNRMSLAEIWNGDRMRYYRRAIAGNNYRGLCQPECISGQVRDKICRID